ncbi:hypothetical protein [Psychroserpens sp.]
MTKENFPKNTPHIESILEKSPGILANEGSCVAGLDGEWLVRACIT